VAWTVFAMRSEQRASFILSHGAWMVSGAIIPFVIIMTFFYAMFHPCVAIPN